MKDKLNIPQERLEIIERYLKDMMLDNEKAQFNKRIAQEPLLKEQVEEVKLFRLGIRKAVLITKLDGFHEDTSDVSLTSEERKIYKLNFKHFAVAASVALIFGAFWFLNRGTEHERLFAKHFEPDYGLATNMSESKNYDLFDAMVDYREGNYNTAIKKWEAQLVKKPTNDTLNYFLGVSYLAKDKKEEAILRLNKVITDSKSAFNKEAYLYLGLAYLKSGNIVKAKENLALSNTEKGRLILSEFKD